MESCRAGGPTQSDWWSPRPNARSQASETEGKCDWPKIPNHSKTIRPLNILQWNAEGVVNKKVPLTERLHKEEVDVACIQETHLNTNHRFSIRGYKTFRLDREGRHKGGVLILVRNNIAASDFKVNTNQQAEIHGVKITVDNSTINVLNLCCPPDKDLSLQHNLYMCHHKTAWLLVISTATQRPGAMARLTVEETKWRTGRQKTTCFCWMIQKTHQLSSRDVGSRCLLQTWPLQLKTCPEKTTGRSWASWQAAITDQYYWQSTCSTGTATQRPFPDGITRRPTGRCSLALQMSTARQLRLTSSISTKPLTALTSPSWEQPLRQSSMAPGRTTGLTGLKRPNSTEQHSP